MDKANTRIHIQCGTLALGHSEAGIHILWVTQILSYSQSVAHAGVGLYKTQLHKHCYADSRTQIQKDTETVGLGETTQMPMVTGVCKHWEIETKEQGCRDIHRHQDTDTGMYSHRDINKPRDTQALEFREAVVYRLWEIETVA